SRAGRAREAAGMAYARNWIGGTWEEPGPHAIETIDPASGERIGVAPRTSAADVARAVAAAKEAFPSWASRPAPRRAEVLFRLAAILEQRKDELARIVTREMGKVREEALGDVQEAADMAYLMGGE